MGARWSKRLIGIIVSIINIAEMVELAEAGVSREKKKPTRAQPQH